MIAGWLLTRTRAMPAEAATAISGARSRVPASSSSAPWRLSIAAPMDVVVGRTVHGRALSDAKPSVTIELLDRDDAVAAQRQNRACHHFDGFLAAAELERRGARRLDPLDAETLETAPQRFAVDRDPIHGDAIEGRLVALRVDIFAQRAADTLRQRQ